VELTDGRQYYVYRGVTIMKSVLVYSGGMDSTSALYLFKPDIIMAVHFKYGSNHSEQELKCARFNCEKLGIPLKVINLEEIFKGMKSSLLGSEDIPHGHYEDDNMRSTVVPFRNGIMLSIATAIAEDIGADNVMIASHAGDHAIYPDCREEFNAGMRAAMSLGTYNNIELLAPFSNKTKHEICLEGVKAGMKIEDTYSCYEGGTTHCGKCGTCVEREEAIQYVKDNYDK
jgi:7-cyano-7-deazaguanine synthase